MTVAFAVLRGETRQQPQNESFPQYQYDSFRVVCHSVYEVPCLLFFFLGQMGKSFCYAERKKRYEKKNHLTE